MPKWKLCARKTEEKHTRKEAELHRAHAKVTRQIRRNHTNGIVQELADEMDETHRGDQQHKRAARSSRRMRAGTRIGHASSKCALLGRVID